MVSTNSQLWRRDGDVQRSWDFPAEMKGRRVQAMALGADGRLWLSMLGRCIHTFKDGIKRITAAEIKLAVSRGGRVNVLDEFNHLDGLEGVPAQIAPLPSLVQGPIAASGIRPAPVSAGSTRPRS